MKIFYDYAEKIWHRIRFARQSKLKISKTTITETLIYDLWFAARKQGLPIEIYESKQENVNGSDLIYL